MDEDDSSIQSIETLEAEPNPSCSGESDDCRINCFDRRSLCSIMKITLAQVSELADSCNLNDDRSEFITEFSNTFKNALQENIVINGLPWFMDQSNLTTPQKEDHKQMVDDVLLAKLSKTVSDVAHKRRFCPEQCCRIMNIKLKHELQNLKKAKVVNDSTVPTDIPVKSISRNKIKPFVEFCKEFKTIQESVQYRLQKRRELKMQMDFAYDLRKSHIIRSSQVATETSAKDAID